MRKNYNYCAGRVNWSEELRVKVYPDGTPEQSGLFCNYYLRAEDSADKLFNFPVRSSLSNYGISGLVDLAEFISGHSSTVGSLYSICSTQKDIRVISSEVEYVEEILCRIVLLCQCFVKDKLSNTDLIQIYRMLATAPAIVSGPSRTDTIAAVLSVVVKKQYRGSVIYEDPLDRFKDPQNSPTGSLELYYPVDQEDSAEKRRLVEIATRRRKLYEVRLPPDSEIIAYVDIPENTADNDIPTVLAGKLNLDVKKDKLTVLNRNFAAYPHWNDRN